MKCWIIEQGEYSDYRVVGIFSTKENAERALKYIAVKEDYYQPEIVERELDPVIDKLNEGLWQFMVQFLHDSETTVRIVKEIEPSDLHWTQGDLYHIWAKDPEHAIKIAAEKHAQYQYERTLTHAQD